MKNLSSYFLIRKSLLLCLLTLLTTQLSFSQEWLVTNYGTNQIRKVNVTNGTSTLWSTAVTAPLGIAIDNNGFVWVTSWQNNSNESLKVYRLSSSGALLNTITVESQTFEGNNGWQISLGADNLLYMSGTNRGSFTINPNTYAVNKVSTNFSVGIEKGTSSAYIRSNSNHIFRSSTQIISNASSGSWVDGVRGLHESNNYIFSTDGADGVVNRYNASGSGQITFVTLGGGVVPTGIELGTDGFYYIVGYTSNRIYRVNSSGSGLTTVVSSNLSGPKFMVELPVCNPDNSSASYGFCAPTPNCPTSSFLWSQSINSTDGSTPLRLFCGSTTSYTIPGPYPAAYNSGVSINVSDVVSYDGYASRNTVTQANERWRIVFKKNGIVQASTGYTNDVPDLVTQGYWRGSLGTVILPSGTDQIVIEHWSVANDGSCTNTPNSVVP
ncbi:MAG: hypothetical protein WAT37_19595, partial [Saprospiraceae bacterium]